MVASLFFLCFHSNWGRWGGRDVPIAKGLVISDKSGKGKSAVRATVGKGKSDAIQEGPVAFDTERAASGGDLLPASGDVGSIQGDSNHSGNDPKCGHAAVANQLRSALFDGASQM